MRTEAGDVALSARVLYSLGLTISPLLPLATGRASRWPSLKPEQGHHQPRALGADLRAGWKWVRARQVVLETTACKGSVGLRLLPQDEAGGWERLAGKGAKSERLWRKRHSARSWGTRAEGKGPACYWEMYSGV